MTVHGSLIKLSWQIEQYGEGWTINVRSVGLASDFSGAQDAGAFGLGDLEKRLDREEFVLVTVGRPLISDPGWVRKIRAGQAQQLRGFDAADLAELV